MAKAAEAALVRGENIESFIRRHLTVCPLDFMLRTKINRKDKLILETPVMWGDTVVTTKTTDMQRVTRYYVSKDGGYLIKLKAPLVLFAFRPHTAYHSSPSLSSTSIKSGSTSLRARST